MPVPGPRAFPRPAAPRAAGRGAWCVAGALLLALVAAGGAAAQDDARNVTFAHLTSADGLPSVRVTTVVQDRLGFIWVGTVDGLARYDGYDVREYRHDEGDETTLSDNVVMALLPARDGALWVGTEDGGLDRYDPATDAFTHFRSSRRDANSLPSDGVLALAEGRDGTVWVGTTGGLARYDPVEERFTRYRHRDGDPRSLPHDEVMAVWADPAGPVWVGTEDGLARLDPARGTFTTYRDADPYGRTVAVVRPREAGGLWVGTWGAGLRVFDPRSGRFTGMPLGDDNIAASVVSSLFQDRQGTLWVGTYGAGLYELPVGGAPRVHRTRDGDASSLADDAVSAVMQDRQGVLWVGTYNGLDRFDRARGEFRLARRVPDDPAALPSNNVRALLTTRDGALWIGTDRGLARALDSTLTRFEVITDSPTPRPDRLANGNVAALYQDETGTLWVGTRGELDRIDGRTRQISHIPIPAADGGQFVGAITGQDGEVWVGTSEAGLLRISSATAQVTRFVPDARRPASLADEKVNALTFAGGRLWVGTAAGLDRLDDARSGGRFTHFSHDPTNPRSLCGSNVTTLLARSNGTLWVGTGGGGLCRLDVRRPDGGFERWTEEEGLPGNVVRAIVEDASGFLWISTSRGLARMDPVTGAFRPFDTQAGEFNVGAAATGSVGGGARLLYFGAAGGLLAFSPGQASVINPNPPGVVLTGVRLFNEPLLPSLDGYLREAAPVATVLRLPYSQDVVTFEFAAIHFADPRGNTYRFRLEGFDEEWRENGTLRTATYTSLPPGSYTFRVQATSADGVPSEDEAAIRLVVRPPWWRTPWAYLLYLGLLGGLVFTADRVQRRRVQRQERERAARAEAELRAVMAETETRALKAESEQLKAEDERKAAELARQQAEVERAREVEAKSKEIARAYTALEASLRDLRATQAQLLQQEKLASLGQLTAGIAHEIKNPLNFVNNFAELSVDLADELEAELTARADRPVSEAMPEMADLLGDLRENARRIHEHGRRADRIVKNMLAHSRGGAGERARTDVNRFVDEYANLAYHGMRAKEAALNVAIQREFDPDVGEADVVPQDLGRVLVNLLNNAFYAVAERARRESPGFLPTVTVSTRRLEGAPARVEIRVADNGTGIPEDARARIFEPFFTTKPSGEGTGLGLSLAHEIVARGHNGTLEVESTLGEGSAFVIRLPLPEA